MSDPEGAIEDNEENDEGEDSDEDDAVVLEAMTERCGCSSIAQESPPFTVEDNSEEIRRNKIHAFLASLTPNSITNQIIANCVRIAKSQTMLASLGVTNLANKVLPPGIVDDERFQSVMVKVEQEEQVVDQEEYPDSLRPGQKAGRPGAAQQEFDYKSWERRTTNYPKVDITDEMQVQASTAFLAFRWNTGLVVAASWSHMTTPS